MLSLFTEQVHYEKNSYAHVHTYTYDYQFRSSLISSMLQEKTSPLSVLPSVTMAAVSLLDCVRVTLDGEESHVT